ncbi:methyltransferase domain-containing protein [Candidatus Ichthyocystis sparus]|uniref:methyltransferase domain-containing protein n=1 Tax=Candidatus Ichthyocystis sparus TaxID=1561004 RepID=UPI000B851C76|nr:methyltransferase domain-containing protein [Candidatus Ichthyocystis sparus]
MSYSTKVVQRCFRRVGKVEYDEFDLHRIVAQSLCDRLSGIKKPSNPVVLDLASGPGTIVFPVFSSAFGPDSYWIFVDLVEEFLQYAHKKYSASIFTSWFRRQKVCFLVADVRELPLASSSVDVMIANIILPCIADRRAAFREWRRVLKPGGLFLFSCLGPSTFLEIRWAFSFVDSYSHTEYFPDMHDVADELIQEGFQDVVVDVDIKQTAYSSFNSLCHDLKKAGVFYVRLDDKRHGLISKKEWETVVSKYESLRHGKGLPLTWELIFGHAWGAITPPQHHGEERNVIKFFSKKTNLSRD